MPTRHRIAYYVRSTDGSTSTPYYVFYYVPSKVPRYLSPLVGSTARGIRPIPETLTPNDYSRYLTEYGTYVLQLGNLLWYFVCTYASLWRGKFGYGNWGLEARSMLGAFKAPIRPPRPPTYSQPQLAISPQIHPSSHHHHPPFLFTINRADRRPYESAVSSDLY